MANIKIHGQKMQFHKRVAISVTLTSGTGGTATFEPVPSVDYTLSSLPIGAQIVKVSGDYLIKYNNTTIGEIELYESSGYELNDVVVIRSGVDTSVTTTPITLQDLDTIYVAFKLSAYRVTLASDNPNFGNWMNETTGAGPINYIDVPTNYAFAAVDKIGTGQYMNKPGVMLARDPNAPLQDYVLLSANSGPMALLGITYYDGQGNSIRISTTDQFGVDFSSNVKFEMNLGELYDLISESTFVSILDACRRDPTMIGLTTDWQVSANWGFCNDNGRGRYIYVCVGSIFKDWSSRPPVIRGAEFAVVKYDRNNESYVYSNFDLNTMPSGFDNYYNYLLQVQSNGSSISLEELYNHGPYQDKSSYGNWMASYFNS